MPFRTNKTFRQILADLQLEPGLQLCLDAGDAASYTSGQKWLDRANGYDFFLGTTGGAEASDPTFNGVAGNLSENEYFSVDGADFFRYDSTNEAWMDSLHKDNAKLSACGWFYINTLGVSQGLFGDSNSGFGGIGVSLSLQSSNILRFAQAYGGSPTAKLSSVATVPSGWNFLGVSIDEGATVGILQINSIQETQTYSYTTPSSSSASFTFEIGSYGSADSPLASGDRIGAFMMWSGVALTAAQLMSIYQYPGVAFSSQVERIVQTKMIGY